MNLVGSGTGMLDYQINEELPVENAACAVQGTEDDTRGVLVLLVSFDDAVHGAVIAGLTLSDFAPGTIIYTDVGALEVMVDIKNVGGMWRSGSESSVRLSVTTSENLSGCVYTGSFEADNLTWLGDGSQDAMAIKWGSYSMNVQPQEGP